MLSLFILIAALALAISPDARRILRPTFSIAARAIAGILVLLLATGSGAPRGW